MAEQVVADIASSLGATVAVVDANECPKGPGLNLALVLEDLVGLDHGHGEISGGRPSDIAKPQQSMLAFSSTGTVAAVGAEHADGIEFLTAEWLQAEREQIHQCLEHPTSLINPNPNSSQREHWNLFRRLRNGSPSFEEKKRGRETLGLKKGMLRLRGGGCVGLRLFGGRGTG